VLLEELPEELPELVLPEPLPELVLPEPLLEELVLDVLPELELLLAPELEELPPLLPLLEVPPLAVPPSSQGFEFPEELQAAPVPIMASTEATATSLEGTVLMRILPPGFLAPSLDGMTLGSGMGQEKSYGRPRNSVRSREGASARGGMRWSRWTDVGRRRPQTDGNVACRYSVLTAASRRRIAAHGFSMTR
jgi:hypothetical protein